MIVDDLIKVEENLIEKSKKISLLCDFLKKMRDKIIDYGAELKLDNLDVDEIVESPCLSEIIIMIHSLEQLYKINDFLKKLFPDWTGEIKNVWMSENENIYCAFVYKKYPLEIWLKSKI